MFSVVPPDAELARLLMNELAQGFDGRMTRLRELATVEAESPTPNGKLLFGGVATVLAYEEARSSFVHGNFAATILLTQMLLEHLLSGYASMAGEQLGRKPEFKDTLSRCEKRGLLSTGEVADIRKLIALRNPLLHYRDTDDADHLMRRSIREGQVASDFCEDDARFAITLITRFLGKRPFAV